MTEEQTPHIPLAHNTEVTYTDPTGEEHNACIVRYHAHSNRYIILKEFAEDEFDDCLREVCPEEIEVLPTKS